MIAARLTLLPLAGALALATACDWRTFDDLSDEAWAQAAGSPSDINAGEFATNVAASGDLADGTAIFVSTQRPDGLALLRYDGSGSLTSGGELIADGADTPDPLSSRPPLVGDPTSDEGLAVVGLSTNGNTEGRVMVYAIGDGEPSLEKSYPVGTDAVDALAVGAVNNDGTAGVIDLVVTTGGELTVVGDYTSDSRSVETCTFVNDRAFAAEVAELDSSSDEGEIVVAWGNENMDGAASSVAILAGSTVAAAAADTQDQSCFAGGRMSLGVLNPPGDEPDFGADLVVADFDGGGGLDLAVGAPSSGTVYVYMNVDLSGGLPSSPTEVTAPDGIESFGATLAAGDFDGDGNDELVIGAPFATAEGVDNAGRAYLVTGGGDFATMNVLGDADPTDDQSFGRGLAVGSFGGTGTVLSVATRGEVFTYFRTHLSDEDVRE